MNKVIGLILGGGQGTRLFPLTKDRSKPAVPIGGKYRLIDVPITNCIRSQINRIFIITQFNSESLNKHIAQTYRFDNFHSGFVNILAAEQTNQTNDWYQGTADAVRKNLKHILAFHDIKYVLILSGDQIYRLNLKKLIDFHKKNKNDITICVKPIRKNEASSFGIMKVDADYVIKDFYEKPKTDEILENFLSQEAINKRYPDIDIDKPCLASMGIYIFNLKSLINVLDNNFTDFGKEIIPHSIKTHNTGAYFFNDYWEDVGSIKTFLKANLDFTAPVPKFNLYENSIYTHARYLPPSKVVHCNINQAMLAEGSIIENSYVENSIIGIRSILKNNVTIKNSIIMGADYYENEADKRQNHINNLKDIGIDENTVIENAIVDKNTRIGKNCIIANKNNLSSFDGPNYFIRESIVIIPKNAVIEDNTVI